MKENVNINNRHDSDIMSNKIIQEKENYIYKLEGECSEMRKELEQLREKLNCMELNQYYNVLDKSINSNGPLPNSGTISAQTRSGTNFFSNPHQRSALKHFNQTKNSSSFLSHNHNHHNNYHANNTLSTQYATIPIPHQTLSALSDNVFVDHPTIQSPQQQQQPLRHHPQYENATSFMMSNSVSSASTNTMGRQVQFVR
ncbi:hypothetical protein FGO68_gene2678 [Halteria grandinella]|uniref:Uncharacterized protein n=1 Tax=Halteria grandinella TaxID=5974 RepID=A0A8J8NBF0_HALGN|nr:hypothetical protein FGO68_gene2678 [Halteria grandinella]